MHRRKLLALGLTGSAAALTGCMQSGGSGGPAKAETPKQLTTINFYTDKAAWEPSFDDMNKASKPVNLQLKFTGYSDATQYDSFIKQAFRTKKVPDLFTWHTGDQLKQLVDQKLIAETTDLWNKAEQDKLVPEGLKDNYTYDNAQYGVPLNVAYWAMYYNKHVYDKYSLDVPKSWDDLMANCETLLAKGVTPFHQMNVIFEFVWFQLLLIGQSPETYQALQTGDAKYTDPEVVKVAKMWGDMIDKKYFCDPGLKTDPQTLLKTGKVAMAYFGTFFTGQLEAIKAKSGTDYGIFIPPNVNPATKRQQLVIETGPLCVGSGSDHEKEALAYSQWWLGDDAQKAWSASRGDISFNPDVQVSDPELSTLVKQVNDPASDIHIQKRYLEATPVPIYTTETEVFGKFVTNGGDPMPALKQLQASADKYWSSKK